jgi:hypothetical protein
MTDTTETAPTFRAWIEEQWPLAGRSGRASLREVLLIAVETAADKIDALTADVERLRAWKREATEVIGGWEKVYKALGEPGRLAESKAAAALNEVDRRIGVVARVESLLADGLNGQARIVLHSELDRYRPPQMGS